MKDTRKDESRTSICWVSCLNTEELTVVMNPSIISVTELYVTSYGSTASPPSIIPWIWKDPRFQRQLGCQELWSQAQYWFASKVRPWESCE